MFLLPFTMLLALSADGGPAPNPEVDEAVRILRQANIGVDGDSLLTYLRTQTPVPGDLPRLADMIRRLGDDSYDIRERATQDLVAAGRPALPFLRSALHDSDPEIVRRAQSCLDDINGPSLVPQLAATARLLADRRPSGAVQVLLAYLPFAADEDIEDAVLAALLVVGIEAPDRPHEAILSAVTDPRPLRRTAAAHVLGSIAQPAGRTSLSRLVSDEDPRVRYEAAVGLLRQGDRSAGRALIALLTVVQDPLHSRVENTLWSLADDKGPSVTGNTTSAERERGRQLWEAWWKINGERVDLKALNEASPLLGHTLVCEYDGVDGGGRLAEYGRDGTVRWKISNLHGINDAHLLPGGRVLIAERNSNGVTERDRDGKILWSYTSSGAVACQRLPNGNTLIATFSELIEVSPDHKVIHKLSGNFRHTIRIRNGHILAVNSNGQILELEELDGQWKEVRVVTPANYGGGAGYWASIELLPSGRFLVAYGGTGKVVEMDGSGKILWECGLSNCVFATRLRNGHTLVSCFEQRTLVEVDRDGKEVAKTQLQGRPFTVKRY